MSSLQLLFRACPTFCRLAAISLPALSLTARASLQEVKDTLDKKVLLRLMEECYEMHQQDKTKIEELKASAETSLPGAPPAPSGSQSALATARSFAQAGGSLLAGVMVTAV